MEPKVQESLDMLFKAKWNLPRAARNCNLTDEEMRAIFNKYCFIQVPTHDKLGNPII
jgi:hypothetical protein